MEFSNMQKARLDGLFYSYLINLLNQSIFN